MDNFYNKFIGNIYSKTSTKSEVTSQILFGEKFTILNKNKDWFKEKIPGKPEFMNQIGSILNIFSKLPNIMQNQMTIYLYSIDNVDTILLSEDDENYSNRNDHKRIRNTIRRQI